MSHEARRRILERRATFVAAALGAVAATTNCDKPRACLSAVADEKTVDSPDAAVTSLPEVGGTEAPLPCLELAEPVDAAHPAPCLKVHVPRDAGKPSGKPCLAVGPDF